MTAAQTFGVREAPPPFRQFSDDHKARVVSEAMMGGWRRVEPCSQIAVAVAPPELRRGYRRLSGLSHAAISDGLIMA
jgi:hypothetical protein